MTPHRSSSRRFRAGRSRWSALAGVGAVAVLGAGCMTSKVEETRQVAAAIQADESIVVLKKPQLEGIGTEEKFIDCLQENLGGELVHPEQGQSAKISKAKNAVPFKIYGEQEFTDALFPWFEPSTAPANADGLRVLLERPGVVAVAVLGTGCMTSKVEETRQVAAAIQADESIVVLKKPQLEGIGTEEKFIDCLQENLGGELVHPEQGQSAKISKAKNAVPFKIYGEQEFTDALFPWFEPSTAPANADGLRVLLERPGVVQRLELIGVRYVVWLDGQTRKTDGGGSIACGAGPGGAGCIGVGWWEKQSGYVASVWDMQTGSELGSVSTDVTGTSVLIGAVAPIPIIAPVQRTACNRLAEQLRSFLGGADLVGGGAAAGGSGGSR